MTSSFLACSSDDQRAGSVSPIVEAGVIEASDPDEASVRPELPAGYDAGVGLGLVDVADTPCSARVGSLAVVLPGGADAAPRLVSFRSLQTVGERRVADAVDGTGFVAFDADGKNGTFVTTSLHGGGTTSLAGQILFAGARDFDNPAIQAYGGNGAPVGSEVVLATGDPEGLALGIDNKEALAVWATKNSFRARGFAGGAAAGQGTYELAVGASSAEPSIAISSVKEGLFAVVFSGTGSGYQTAFGRGSTTARVGDPSNLFTGEVPRRVAGLARTPSGFALLMTIDDRPIPYAMMVLMNLGGLRTTAGLKLTGTREASAIAVNGSTIGVLAHRRDNANGDVKIAPEFRAFDLEGAPLGPWVCLDTPGTDSDLGGGLVADGAGFAAAFRAADGSLSLARFGTLGTGSP